MIFISKYYIINIEIAQFIVAIEVLFAILCLTFLYCLLSSFSLHLNKIFCLINFDSTNSQRILNENIFYNNKSKLFILFEEIKIPGITVMRHLRLLENLPVNLICRLNRFNSGLWSKEP